jgi:hypothetical protein
LRCYPSSTGVHSKVFSVRESILHLLALTWLVGIVEVGHIDHAFEVESFQRDQPEEILQAEIVPIFSLIIHEMGQMTLLPSAVLAYS